MMKEEWILVTPAIAKQWLTKNTSNRRLRKRTVVRYACDMKAGQWLETHQAIAFSEAGVLLDGQHRLAAVIESGVSQRFLVVTGCSHESQLVVDKVLPRGAADSITLEGSLGPVSNKEVAIARLLAFGPDASSDVSTTMAIKSVLETHREAIAFAALRQTRKRGMSAPVMAVVARAWYTADRGLLDAFCEVLSTGICPRGDADSGAAILGKFAMSTTHGGGTYRSVMYRKAEKALSHFLEGRPVTKLYEEPDELFPIPGEEAFDKSQEVWEIPV